MSSLIRLFKEDKKDKNLLMSPSSFIDALHMFSYKPQLPSIFSSIHPSICVLNHLFIARYFNTALPDIRDIYCGYSRSPEYDS